MNNKQVIDTLAAITTIFNHRDATFEKQLQRVLHEIVWCIGVGNGSIMLRKGHGSVEVVASTDAQIIGIRQPLSEASPSALVVKNKTPLYIEDISNSDIFLNKFSRYKGLALLLTPILLNKKVIGIICLTDKIGEDRFSKKEREVLLKMAELFISAHENQRLMDALKQKQRTLKKKNVQLIKYENLRTDFFNMLIHDLKGPISELIANLDILSYTASEKNQEFVESAKLGCDTLYNMVNNLLDIARLEEGKLELFYEMIDPEDLIKEALARLFGSIKIKELKFVERFPIKKTIESFWGDRGILLRVLQNLLTNAIGFSPTGETIEVGFEALKDSKIRFSVKDRGPGIPAEHRKAIFDKHFQLEKKGDGRIYTTGLGLTFCRMAVKTHRGKIAVESRESTGSCFYFILPIHSQGPPVRKTAR